MVIELVTEEELEEPVAGKLLTQEITIGTVSQEEIPIHAGEVKL